MRYGTTPLIGIAKWLWERNMELIWATPNTPNSLWWSFGFYFTSTFGWQVTCQKFVQSLQVANVTSCFAENFLIFYRRWIHSTFIWWWLCYPSIGVRHVNLCIYQGPHVLIWDSLVQNQKVSWCLYRLFVNNAEWIMNNCEVKPTNP